MIERGFFLLWKSEKFIFLLALGLFFLKLYASFFVELGNDEVYYTLYAKQLQWSYFDHPPMVGLSIFLSTIGGLLKDEFFVRFIPILLGSVNIIIVYKLVREISSETTARVAAFLFSSSIYVQVIAGFFILPDSILITWLLLSFKMINRIFLLGDERLINWIYLACFLGLGFLSKYNVAFFIFGLLLYIFSYRKDLLLRFPLWFTLFIFLFFTLPVIYWNYSKDFISFRFHEGRVGPEVRFEFIFFIREVLGVFFYNNPITILLMIIFFKKRRWIQSGLKYKGVIVLYLFCSLPIIVFFLLVSISKPTLPHWAAPGYTMLIIPLAFVVSKKLEFIKWSLLFFIIIFLLAPISIRFFNFSKDDKPTHAMHLGKNDVTLDLYGWKNLGDSIQLFFKRENKKNSILKSSAFVIDKWFPGAHIQYYIADKLSWPTYGVGPISDIHQFYFYNQNLPAMESIDNWYYITTSHYYRDPYKILFFQDVQLLKEIPIVKSSDTCAWAYLFEVKGLKGPF